MSPFPIKKDPFFFILFFYTLSSFIYHYPLSLSLSISLNSIYLQYIKSFITFYSSFEFPNTCFCFFDLKLLKNSFDLTRVVDYLFLTHTYLISFLLIPRYIYTSISHIHILSSRSSHHPTILFIFIFFPPHPPFLFAYSFGFTYTSKLSKSTFPLHIFFFVFVSLLSSRYLHLSCLANQKNPWLSSSFLLLLA